MVFDTDRDQGIRMVSDRVSIEDIKARFFADTSYASQAEYCEAYRQFFGRGAFDEEEYRNLGTEGCSAD